MPARPNFTHSSRQFPQRVAKWHQDPHNRLSASEVTAIQAPWRNLIGPVRTLAISATVLLIASALLAVEAGILLILGPDRNIVIKPFILLGYLEACAMFFSLLFIVLAIVGMIFYRPYQFISEKFSKLRGRRAAEVRYTIEDVPQRMHVPNPEEDGAPD